ncbi:RepB family protein [Serratia bockelmannii]|uniref:RepB family protein n=1 Tax=Serratia bockelmannii TaxID=2703793 RepID=UPI0038C62417
MPGGESKQKRRPVGPQKTRQEIRKDFLERRKLTHKRLDIYITNGVRNDLDFLMKIYGKTQVEIIEDLIRTARKNCGFKDPV